MAHLNSEAVKQDRATAITHHPGGTTLTGNAIELYRWGVVRAGLQVYQDTGILVNRGATPAHLLRLASDITHKTYRNNRVGRDAAIADLDISIATLRATIPDVERS